MKSRALYAFISLVLIIFLIPLAMLLGPKQLRSYSHKELVYKVIVDKITEGAKSDQEKALKILDYLHEHWHGPLRSVASDVDQLHHLARNVAWCDSQAGTLVALARKANINGGWVGLYGWDKISHHSVGVLHIDGKYRMFDPFWGYAFIRPDDGQIATLEDIQANLDQLKSKKFEALKMIGLENIASAAAAQKEYYKLFEPDYPWKITPLTWPGYKRKLVSTIIDSYYEIFGRGFLILFQELYFKVDSTEPLLKARLKHLVHRYQSAINDYDNILPKKHPGENNDLSLINQFSADNKPISNENLKTVLPSELMFFKGQAFWDMKDFAKSAETFENLLIKYPDNRWLGIINFYLGNSYENLNKIDKAINTYKKVTHTNKQITVQFAQTPGPINLMNLN